MQEPRQLIVEYKDVVYRLGNRRFPTKLDAAKTEAWYLIYQDIAEKSEDANTPQDVIMIDDLVCTCKRVDNGKVNSKNCKIHDYMNGYFAILHRKTVQYVLDTWNKK